MMTVVNEIIIFPMAMNEMTTMVDTSPHTPLPINSKSFIQYSYLYLSLDTQVFSSINFFHSKRGHVSSVGRSTIWMVQTPNIRNSLYLKNTL